MSDAPATIEPTLAPSRLHHPRLLWIARCLVAVVVAVAGACSLGYILGPEHFWLLAEVQYLPFPFLLVPALVAVALSWALAGPWRVAAMAALAMILTIMMGFQFHTGDAGTHRIRVMTYNVKGYLARRQPAGFAPIAREIALQNPDILVLQDATDLADLEEKSPGAARAIFGELHAYFNEEYVVASRFPMRECMARHVAILERHHSHVRCIVAAPGVELEVMTAHFMTPRFALNAARGAEPHALDEWRQNLRERTLQAEALADDVRSSRRPVILAGDLNAPETSLVVRALLATGLRGAFSSAGKGYGYTWGHSLRPGISFLRIDHILVGAELAVSECFVGGDEASPHRPVVTDLYLKRNRG